MPPPPHQVLLIPLSLFNIFFIFLSHLLQTYLLYFSCPLKCQFHDDRNLWPAGSLDVSQYTYTDDVYLRKYLWHFRSSFHTVIPFLHCCSSFNKVPHLGHAPRGITEAQRTRTYPRQRVLSCLTVVLNNFILNFYLLLSF